MARRPRCGRLAKEERKKEESKLREESIRLLVHGSAWFPREKAERILVLMHHQCSATRSAYQAIHKHGLYDNDVVKYVKQNYMEPLNQRYVADAVSNAKIINQEHVIFGSRKAWKFLIKGKITRDQWTQKRNSQLYSRGDRSKFRHGNANIRIVGDKIFVNDPSERGLWIEGKVHFPKKFKNFPHECYDSRLIYAEGEKFKLAITWEEPAPIPKPSEPGACAVDTNPDGLAISELNGDGNLVHHHYEMEQRIQFASKDKRDNDVRQVAIRVVNFAKARNKPIVIEDLKFKDKQKKKKGKKKKRKKSFWRKRKSNRMKSNFVHKKLLTAIKRRAQKQGVKVIEVQPAFTSVLGALKYQEMYSLSVHNAAAMVIGRRGMGLMKERRDFDVTETDKLGKDNKRILNLAGRGTRRELSNKAWSWLKDKFLKPKPVAPTEHCLAAERFSVHRAAPVHNGDESNPITGRIGQEMILQGNEKAPLELGKHVQVS